MGVLTSLLDPRSYLRLFQNNEIRIKKDKDKDKSIYKELQEKELQLKKAEDKSKNIVSLSLIFREVKSNKYINGYCPARLNTLLTFELYITLSHHINLHKAVLDKLYSQQEQLDSLSDDYQKIQSNVNDEYRLYDDLKELLGIVVKTLKPELLYQLTSEYNNMTAEEHCKKCLL